MTSREYVRRYFSDSARQWLARAYDDVEETAAYPVGAQRTRLALEAVVDRLGTAQGHLVDLGCGGGNLALHVEYLAADEPFLAETARLLRGGGVLVVSCRNRLFNATSGNDYTREEIETGSATGLLEELATLRPDRAVVPLLGEVVARLREALPGLERALAKDAASEGARVARSSPVFGQRRRQHSPAGFAAAAAAAGFRHPRFFGVHPHVLSPALEAVAPRFYNRFAAALEPLESAPVSLAWSSAFLAVFTR